MERAAARGVDPNTATTTLSDYGQANMKLALRGLEVKTHDRYLAKTVRNIHAMIHRSLIDAVAWKYILYNPASNIKPPKAPPQASNGVEAGSDSNLPRVGASRTGSRHYSCSN